MRLDGSLELVGGGDNSWPDKNFAAQTTTQALAWITLLYAYYYPALFYLRGRIEQRGSSNGANRGRIRRKREDTCEQLTDQADIHT